MPERIRGFPPIADQSAKVLILGTMPSRESLRFGQYYAHGRNQFWLLVYSALGVEGGPPVPYEERASFLKRNGIALWDVLAECEREGSGDDGIRGGVPNQFTTFLQGHPGIRLILFNGQKAESLFDGLVSLEADIRSHLGFERLPSSSPANARMSFSEKRECWKRALDSRRPRQPC